MNSALMFGIAVAIVLAILLLFTVYKLGGVKKASEYFNSKDGKGILAGIGWFILFAFVLIAVSCQPVSANEDEKIDWFAYGKVYIGVDNTFQVSPQCDPGKVSDKLTSNGGLIVNILQSPDKRFEINSKYTHHSCALNPDNESYDAVGFSLEYRLW